MIRRAALLAAMSLLTAAPALGSPLSVLSTLPAAVADRERALIDRLTIERANALAANDARWASRYGDAARRLEAAEARLRGQAQASAAELTRLQAEKAALADQIADQNRDFAAELAAYRELMTGLVTQASPEKHQALERYASGDRLGAFPILEQITYAENTARDKAAATIAAEADARRRAANAENLRGLGAQALDMVGRGEFAVDRAIPIWEQVTALDPADHWSWIQLGRLYGQAGRVTDQKRAFEASLTAAKDDRAKAVSLASIGDVQLPLGDFVGARRSFQAALSVLEGLAQNAPSADADFDVALATFKLANLDYRAGDLRRAIAGYQRALAIADRRAAEADQSVRFAPMISFVLGFLSDAQRKAEDIAGARASAERALTIERAYSIAHPNDLHADKGLAEALTRVGAVEQEEGANEKAIGLYQQAIGLLEAASAKDVSNLDFKNSLAVVLERMGDVQLASGDSAGAEATYRRLIALAEGLLSVDGASLSRINSLSLAVWRLGDVQVARGDKAGAYASYKRMADLSDQGLARSPGNPDMLANLQGALDSMGRISLEQRNFADARAAYERSQAINSQQAAAAPDDLGLTRSDGIISRRLGNALVGLNDRAGARSAYDRAIAATRKVAAARPGRDSQSEVMFALIAAADNLNDPADWRALVTQLELMDRQGLLTPGEKAYLEEKRRALASPGGGA